ncbi:hypothetical protein QYF36_016513 [Acer negundo]|nr:hypothetical protein QYF36_016513 [Acer negundo]
MVKATELTGHTSRVRFIAQSPDGCTVASAAAGNTLRIWNNFGDPEVAKFAPKAAQDEKNPQISSTKLLIALPQPPPRYQASDPADALGWLPQVHLVIVLEALKKMIHVADMLLTKPLTISMNARNVLPASVMVALDACIVSTVAEEDEQIGEEWFLHDHQKCIDCQSPPDLGIYYYNDFSNWPPSSSHVEPEPEAIADPEPEKMPYCDWFLEEKEIADRHRMRLDQRTADSRRMELEPEAEIAHRHRLFED